MTPLALARALMSCGIRVGEVYDGDDEEDGSISVARLVNVEVPTFGGAPRVVAQTLHADVRCYPPRAALADLVGDIRDALDELPVSALAHCSIH